MYGSGVAIGMEKAIIVAALVIILKGLQAAVSVFCAAAVGASDYSTVGVRIATSSAALSMCWASLASALSSNPRS